MENSQAQAYLLDSHRPYHHNNVIDKLNKVFVIDDGCKSFLECPTEEDVNIYTNELRNVAENSDSDNSLDSDSLAEDKDDDSEHSKRQRDDSDDGEEAYGVTANP